MTDVPARPEGPSQSGRTVDTDVRRRHWLADSNATVMSVLLLVFAVVLIGKGISGLSG